MNRRNTGLPFRPNSPKPDAGCNTMKGKTVVLFWRVSTIAGMLLLPYEAWVSFAAVLNGSL